MIKKTLAYLVIISVFALSACDSSRVYEKNKGIPGEVWKIEDTVSFETEIADTATPHNLYVNVRNADGYPYNNIYLLVYTTFPNGKIARDTLECILADETGKWLGDGLGDIFDNKILFKKNVRFAQAGKYTFSLQHAMRLNELPLIMDVGIRIEKVK